MMHIVRRHHIRRTRRRPRSHTRQLRQLINHQLPRRLLHQPLLRRRTNARFEWNELDGYSPISSSCRRSDDYISQGAKEVGCDVMNMGWDGY